MEGITAIAAPDFAAVKGKQQVLMLNLDSNSYTAPGKSAVKLPEDMHLQIETAAQEVTSGNSGGIRFFPDGSSTGGHISVLQDRREWRINVASRGPISMMLK